MKIMEWVKNQRENKSWGYYLVLIVLSIFALYLAFGKIAVEISPLPEKLNEINFDIHWLWYFPWAVSIIGIVYIWMYYAPVVCRDVECLRNAFPDTGYRSLYESFEGWLRQLYWNQPGRSRVFKIPYTIFWALYIVCFLYCYCTVFSQNFQGDGGFYYYGLQAFFILTSIIIILNYSSYYICMTFVYFLIRICKLDRDSSLDYHKELPSATSGLQLLNRTANTIYLYFLLDTLFCMIAFCCFWQIIDAEKIHMTKPLWAAFFYVAFFFITLGLISWVVIILVSRTYLYRLHNEWKLRSLKEYEAKECEGEERIEINQIIEKLSVDKISISRGELLISIATIAANIFTAWNMLIPLLKQSS